MKYNILFGLESGSYNLMEIDETKFPIILKAYEFGNTKFTIRGKTHSINKLRDLKIFEHNEKVDINEFEKYCADNNIARRGFGYFWYDEKCLKLLGKDVTEDFIGDNPFGYKCTEENKLLPDNFINISRIQELKAIQHPDFDLRRLIKLCEEINLNYKYQNFLTVGMIGRTILNHIPPIFSFASFDQVASNYSGKSFKNNMQSLNTYFKNIIDIYLHQPIRKNDSLPNETQIDFKQPFDVLLQEVICILNG